MTPSEAETARRATAAARPWEASARWGLALALGLAGCLFVASAATRTLNFDESLALRAGWLELAGIEAEPSLTMPATLGFAAAARVAGDPGAAFVANRVLVALAVLGALAFALSCDRIPAGARALAALIALSQASFAVHAYEFRYDSAILIGWLLAYRWLLHDRPSRAVQLAIGAVLAGLALHHLKGVFFAGSLGLLVVARHAACGRRHLLLVLGRVAAGAGATAAVWFAVLALTGRASGALRMYDTFFGLALASSPQDRWADLWPHLWRDRVWWIAALLSVAITALLALRSSERKSWLLLALGFAAAPLAFLVAHPRPWPYMLAPAAPFLGLVTASALLRLRRPWPALLLLGIALAYQPLSGSPLWSPYTSALAAPMSRQVAALRALRATADAGEEVVDPAGLAYFLPPCRSQWYADTLFAARAAVGDWMVPSLEQAATGSCRWVVVSYRLNMLPPADRRWIVRSFRSVSGPLLLRADDGRLRRRTAAHELGPEALDSFWW